MNQILLVKDNQEKKSNEVISKKKHVFKLQFFFSMAILIILVTLYIYIRYNNQNTSNQYASNLSNSYQVYRLYSNNTNSENNSNIPSIIGNIDIPKINISYPIISTLTDDLLKISPCRFYGDISDNSNLCIASHKLLLSEISP